jgi:hypothetical protein
MSFRRENVTLGRAYVPDEYARVVTTAELLKRIVDASIEAQSPDESLEPSVD